ncbi:hypothetical protein PHLCEN_2v4217 [Hermanssonia centrifuga]|uniref:Uncharacterized protein n=1 Tax=Hermanssonia centrifuga TaxID=98765 RepID=A0A2R6PYX9_9APHY|nr:hypothetical protein PHLCEN_2v4217 [Hermanssonia centrifuga]
MFNKALLLLPFAVGVMSVTLDVSFFSGASCTGVGMGCTDIESDACCADYNTSAAWQSLSTSSWEGIASNTYVHAMAGKTCSVNVGTVSSAGACFDSGSATGITSAIFYNGAGTALKKRDDDAECTPHPADFYFYSPGDGFKYIVDATNPVHSTNINSATSSEEVEQYILANFEKKVAA